MPVIIAWVFIVFNALEGGPPKTSVPFVDRTDCERAAAFTSRMSPAVVIPRLDEGLLSCVPSLRDCHAAPEPGPR